MKRVFRLVFTIDNDRVVDKKSNNFADLEQSIEDLRRKMR